MDEDFESVYDAYEDLYFQANTSKSRAGMRTKAAEDFMEEVIDYYEVDEESFDAGIGMSLFLNTEYEVSPLEEKLSEEELYEYLEGSL